MSAPAASSAASLAYNWIVADSYFIAIDDDDEEVIATPLSWNPATNELLVKENKRYILLKEHALRDGWDASQLFLAAITNVKRRRHS